MINVTEKQNCSGCGACAATCPKNCITMKSDEEGFLYPQIDMKTCVDCGICENICPILNDNNNSGVKKPTAYAAYNKNDEVRISSSSGGIFYPLAKNIILSGGVVFGACFDEKIRVFHNWTDTVDGILKFQGSKYVQSDIGDSFVKAREFLDAGRVVLFTGTPCQIVGLKAFLKKDYDNLLCQDFICHGVPSPKVLEKYLKFRESKSSAKIKNLFFRHKEYGWDTYSMHIDFSDGTDYTEIHGKDLYMRSFLSNICLRPSCYNCDFKPSGLADITLADFWGIENVLPKMYDNKGTSLVITNSKKGQRLFEEIKPHIVCEKVNIEDAVANNLSYFKPSVKHKNRDKFMNSISIKPFDKVFNKYCAGGLKTKIKKIIKMILNK